MITEQQYREAQKWIECEEILPLIGMDCMIRFRGIDDEYNKCIVEAEATYSPLGWDCEQMDHYAYPKVLRWKTLK